MILGLACSPLPTSTPAAEDQPSVTVADLWDGAVPEGDGTLVGPLVVISPRTADGTAFFVADPAGGPRSGLRVQLGAVIEGWPPAVGDAVRLGLRMESDGGPPVGRMFGPANGADDGPGVLPEPSAPGDELENGLVAIPGLTVTSAPDPFGDADTDGALGIGGSFGVSPGYGRSGEVVGIQARGRVSARTVEDWTGDLSGDRPVPVDVVGARDLADGTPVVLDGVLLATPWTRDGRQAVLQDPGGDGIWIDREGWDVPAVEGKLGRWTAEIRHDADGPYLRVWTLPTSTGARAVVVGTGSEDGAIVAATVSGLGPPDPFGERQADGWVLDDRFEDLAGLPDPADVVGAVRGVRSLCPFGP